MEIFEATTILSALSHEGRLEIFRLLVRAGPDGVCAGDIAAALASPGSTLSSHLNILSQSGLIKRRRESRSIIYSARYDRMRDMLAFLMEDCCNGSPEVCRPVLDIATRSICCAADQAEGDRAARDAL
jgi:DNA-binding transcriptional ArsR family regulator